MKRLLLLLLLTVSLCSSFVTVWMDPSYSVHLRCEWRGEGKHCKSDASFIQHSQQKTGWYPYPLVLFPDKGQSEAMILARIKARYPENTFTVVNDFRFFEQCEQKVLWCNIGMGQPLFPIQPTLQY